MKACSKCFHSNSDSEAMCERCGMHLDSKPVSLTRTCPAGLHEMDATWPVCAFCKNEGRSNEAGLPRNRAGALSSGETLIEDNRPPGRPTVDENSRTPSYQNVSPGSNPSARKTVVDNGNRQASRSGQETPSDLRLGGAGSNPGRPAAADKGTVFGQAPPIRPQAPAGIARKIVGILVTYTWKPEGQVFHLLQGRNLIGKDADQADIVVEQDKTLSAINTTIQFQTSFRINDRDSMNGTFLNGTCVEEFVPLPNYSTIRTGSTTWTFIAISLTGIDD